MSDGESPLFENKSTFNIKSQKFKSRINLLQLRESLEYQYFSFPSSRKKTEEQYNQSKNVWIVKRRATK